MKKLLIITALLEGTTGLLLVVTPHIVLSLLLGVTTVEDYAILVCRLAGIALITIAIICWQVGTNFQGSATIVEGLLFYNVGAAILLIYAALTGLSSFGIWPVSIAHVIMTVWCIIIIRSAGTSRENR